MDATFKGPTSLYHVLRTSGNWHCEDNRSCLNTTLYGNICRCTDLVLRTSTLDEDTNYILSLINS